jgi:hypothetical protein
LEAVQANRPDDDRQYHERAEQNSDHIEHENPSDNDAIGADDVAARYIGSGLSMSRNLVL